MRMVGAVMALVGLVACCMPVAAAQDPAEYAAASLPGPGGPAAATDPWPDEAVPSPAQAAGALVLTALLGPLYHRLDRAALLRHATRARLLELVAGRPGITLNQAAVELGIHYRSARHHVDKLARFGLVTVVRRGPRCHLLPAGARADSIPERRSPLLDLVVARPGVHLALAARALGRSKSTVRWHIERLEAQGLLCVDRHGSLTRLWPAVPPPARPGTGPRAGPPARPDAARDGRAGPSS